MKRKVFYGSIIGFVLFLILVVLNFTYNGNYNPWAEIFRFMGLCFLVMVIFVLILFVFNSLVESVVVPFLLKSFTKSII